ncbi:septum formation initiator [Croceicoccus sp. Ery5]|uniref:S10 family serine carboxypeptidase-like protein n=1 Tax=Croceicoccus sp. Ery5 TaxID=1703340 RepID=UPI001E4939B4|nr:septum formation initiator [Croceicoccus sp. Ery5]
MKPHWQVLPLAVIFALLWAAVAWLSPAHAQDGPSAAGNTRRGQAQNETASAGILARRPLALAGMDGPLMAEMGVLPVTAGPDTQGATAGYLSYRAENADANRPVIFAFNGGPGAAAAFLHMGALGPVLAQVPQDPAAAAPEEPVWLSGAAELYRVADIVFIDPPGTGFSQRPAGAGEAPYRSVSGDARANAELVAAWLHRQERTDAPVYILGESYGTIRAVAMLDALQELGLGDRLRGVILLGQALNMIETSQRPDNMVTYPVSLPTLAAIACGHGRIAAPCDPQDAADAAARFGRETYLPALFMGRDLPASERRRIAQRLEELSGISAQFYLANDLRISKERFRVELLREQGQVTGRYDARYTAPRSADVTVMMGPDPASVISDIYEKAMRDYLRVWLGIANADAYKVISRFDQPWSYGGADSPFADWPFMQTVETHAAQNRCLRLFVGTGLYDLTTTVGAADYLFAQSNLPRDRWRNEVYGGGHVFYSDDASRTAFLSDLTGFVQDDPCR